VSGVAICVSPLVEIRSIPGAATVEVGSNPGFSQNLRPELQPIGTAQKRPDGSKALWGLEMRQTKKKDAAFGLVRTPSVLRFGGKTARKPQPRTANA
jgi:hypothetical protein